MLGRSNEEKKTLHCIAQTAPHPTARRPSPSPLTAAARGVCRGCTVLLAFVRELHDPAPAQAPCSCCDVGTGLPRQPAFGRPVLCILGLSPEQSCCQKVPVISAVNHSSEVGVDAQHACGHGEPRLCMPTVMDPPPPSTPTHTPAPCPLHLTHSPCTSSWPPPPSICRTLSPLYTFRPPPPCSTTALPRQMLGEGGVAPSALLR